jgi:hypothetical protein
MFVPFAGVESRFYYGLKKRLREGRITTKNSASFISLQAIYIIPDGFYSDNLNLIGGTILTPAWGMRRVWKNHWAFELNTGISINIPDKGAVSLAPALNVRFGYVF